MTTHSGPPDTDIGMESAKVKILMSVTGSRREQRDDDLEVDKGVAAKGLVTTPAGTKRGRSNSSSSSASSSHGEDQIDGEGVAIMQMNLSPEYS